MEGGSYLKGEDPPPADFKPMADLLDERARTMPDKEMYVFRKKADSDNTVYSRTSVTFADVAKKSLNVASGFLRLGLRPGDRIAMFGPPSPQWLYVDYAALRLKVLLVRLPQTVVQSDGLRQFLEQFKCRMLVVQTSVENNDLRILRRTFSDVNDKLHRISLSKDALVYPEMIMFTCASNVNSTSIDMLANQEGDPSAVLDIQASIDIRDPALSFPTSGTTGVPKLPVWDHVHPNQWPRSFISSMGKPGIGQRFFNNRPFTWGGSSLPYAVTLGFTIITADVDLATELSSLQHILEEEDVDLAMIPLFALHQIVNGHMEYLSKVKYVITGGETVPTKLITLLCEQGINVYLGYGATEASGGYVLCDAESKGQDLTILYRPNSGSEMKIISSEGNIVPLGQPGTIWFRGNVCFLHYLDNKEATDAIKDSSGWVSTQDAGIIYPSGLFQILGRGSNLISKGSCKVYPATIENMLKKCDKVDQVVVLGVPDARFGNEIGACVVPKGGDTLTVEELKAFCADNGVVTHGIKLYPEYFIIRESFPLNQSGKVDIKTLLNMFKDLSIKG